jgi:hypothetical protein
MRVENGFDYDNPIRTHAGHTINIIIIHSQPTRKIWWEVGRVVRNRESVKTIIPVLL